jgi:hypothetical protein
VGIELLVGEFEEQATEVEVADFASEGDVEEPGKEGVGEFEEQATEAEVADFTSEGDVEEQGKGPFSVDCVGEGIEELVVESVVFPLSFPCFLRTVGSLVGGV